MEAYTASGASRAQVVLLVLLLFFLAYSGHVDANATWTDAELALLRMQWIGSLPPLAADPTNSYADNPEAAELGHYLFFDKRFSKDQNIACATCHRPELKFTDGLPRAMGIGETTRSAPSITGIAYSPWFFWDGRSDSLWSQALVPLESAVEHGGSRSQYARILFDDPVYRDMYEDVFGELPELSDIARFPENATPNGNEAATSAWLSMTEEDRKAVNRVFVNMGKAIAAYERKLIPGPARFDDYVAAIISDDPAAADGILSPDEIAGLKLFIGKGMCVTCHQGPMFTHNGFHNTGVPDPAVARYRASAEERSKGKPAVDEGRYAGIRLVLNSEFNCLGQYSDAADEDCAELKYAMTKKNETLAAFKVPTLRNIADTAPYMHAGQFKTLAEVLGHYNAVPRAYIGRTDLLAIYLDDGELGQLEAFLRTLSSSYAADPQWLVLPERM